MRSERFHSLRSETNRPTALFGLRLAKCYFPAAPGQSASHAYDGILHVHILPPKRQHFSLSHTGVDGEDVETFEAVLIGCFEQPTCIVGGESDHLRRNRPRWLHHVGHVSREEVPLHGLRESPT